METIIAKDSQELNFRRVQDAGISNIVVLGHSGFIGRQLMQSLRTSFLSLKITGLSHPDVDLTNAEAVKKLEPYFQPDTAVVMCSAFKKQWGDHLDGFHQNISMVVNVARVLENRPVKKFMYFSSAAVYGEDVAHEIISEQTPVCPTSFYGIAKYSSECVLRKIF